MHATRLALVALLVVSVTLVAAPPAAADHVCYTPGDYQVCTYVPGDHLVEDVAREVTGCDRIC